MIRRRSLFAVAALISAFAFVGESAALSNRRISVQFRGPLKDALKRIASDGGINLVVTGNLDQPAEVYLRDVAPEEALRSVASAYHLRVEQQGNIWTLSPMGEKTEAVPSPAPPAEQPSPPSPPPPPTPREQDAVREEQGNEKQKETEVLEGKEAQRKMKELDRKLRHRRFGRKGSGDRIHKGDLVISEGETVNSAVVYGGKLTVNGEIAGDAVAIGGSVTINGRVSGDVVAIGGGVQLGSKSVVDGDVTSVGGEITKEEGAEVAGNQASIADAGLAPFLTGGGLRPADWGSAIRNLMRGRYGELTDHEHHMPGFLRFLVYFALLFGSGFLFFMFAPARMKQVESEVRSDPLRCGLTGLVGLFALIPLTVLLAITVIGIPFAAVLWLAAMVGIVMGFCAIAHEIGMRLPWFKLRKTQAGVLAVGILVLMLVGIVPILGAITLSLIVMLAFGAVIRTRFGRPRGLSEPIPAVPA